MQKRTDGRTCAGTACWPAAKSWEDSEWNSAPRISSNFRAHIKICAASQPTPCSRVLIAKLTVPQLVEKLTAFHVTRSSLLVHNSSSLFLILTKT